MSDERTRILVAGGAGFLGSHLCERLLERGAEVDCVDNLQTGSEDNLMEAARQTGFRFFRADIIDPQPAAIAGRSYDVVYNLACAASPPAYQRDPEHTMLTSVLGTLNLLKLAERCGARLLFTSTSEVYGDPLVHPQREDYRGNVNPIGPRACYDEGKRAAETLCFDYDRAGRVSVRVARLFNTYGPRLRPEDGRVVSNFCTQSLAGEPLTIYGDGEQTRSFCYVEDMIRGLMLLADHDGDQPGPVNIGNPNEITIRQLADSVREMTGHASPLVRRPLPTDDPQRRKPVIDLAKRVLGWEPRVALEDGLRRTLDWFAVERQPAQAA